VNERAHKEHTVAIRVDPDQIQQIAAACQRSSENIQGEAANMQRQMQQLQEALAGVPNIALAQKFEEWNGQFSSLASALADSQKYLNSVVQSVEDFVAALGR
jgi:WXG100 family type VII secretion target